MSHWIRRLARHYERLRGQTPNTPLALVFDIDGTILDVAPAVRQVLQRHDTEFGTRLLETATEAEIATADWPAIVSRGGGGPEARAATVAALHRAWYRTDAALAAHRPFSGVLEVIRWFQMQPGTHVALNTARTEAQRLDTLRLLNRLGAEYRVRFTSELLFMRADESEEIATAKARGLARLRERGYCIVSVVDNQPQYLPESPAGPGQEAPLTFQADAIHEARRRAGQDLRELLGGRLPRHVQFVWQHIHSEGELQRFLTSSIHWGEVHLAGFRDAEPMIGGGLSLARALAAMLQRARRCKIRVGDGQQLARLIPWLQRGGYPPEALWLEVPAGPEQPELLRRLAEALPGSIRQCALEALMQDPQSRLDTKAVQRLARMGATRFSLDWSNRDKSAVLDRLDTLGLELHLHSLPDLEAFLHASLLLPRSLGTAFDFPQLNARRRAG